MSATALSLPTNAIEAMLADVRHHGHQRLETGGLLLTRPGSQEVTTVAIAGCEGVHREWGLFVLTMPAFDALFSHAEDAGLQARAMWHSHERAAFLSRTDRQQGLRMRGFTSTVIPTYRTPPGDPGSWGWWTYDGGDWQESPPAVAHPAATATIVSFDQGGVRER